MLYPRPTSRSRVRSHASPVLVEELESRTLMSAAHLSVVHPFSKGGSGKGGSQQQASVTPITDLTGAPATVNAITGIPFEGTVATITSASTPVNLNGYRVAIDWGDGSTGKGKIRIADDGSISVRGEHRFATAGTFTVTVTLTQPGAAAPLQIASTANVTQNTATGVIINGAAGTPFTGAVGTFTIPPTDPNTDPSTFLALINWGDHTTSAGQVTLNLDGSYSVSGTHTYAVAGTYRIGAFVVQTTPLEPEPGDIGDDHGGGGGHGSDDGAGHHSAGAIRPATSGSSSNSGKKHLKDVSRSNGNNDPSDDDSFEAVIFSTAIIV